MRVRDADSLFDVTQRQAPMRSCPPEYVPKDCLCWFLQLQEASSNDRSRLRRL